MHKTKKGCNTIPHTHLRYAWILAFDNKIYLPIRIIDSHVQLALMRGWQPALRIRNEEETKRRLPPMGSDSVATKEQKCSFILVSVKTIEIVAARRPKNEKTEIEN